MSNLVVIEVDELREMIELSVEKVLESKKVLISDKLEYSSWLTVREASNYSGYKQATLRSYACKGIFKTRKAGGRLEISKSSIDQYLALNN